MTHSLAPANPDAFNNHQYLTAKQYMWLYDLINDRVGTDNNSLEVHSWRKAAREISSRDRFEAAKNALYARARLDEVVPVKITQVSEAGLYRNPENGDLFRVREVTRTKRGRKQTILTADRLKDINGKRLTLKGEVVHLDWEHWNIFTIDANWLVDTQELAEFGIRYGICARCWRTLVDAESVARGIGPVCRKAMGI